MTDAPLLILHDFNFLSHTHVVAWCSQKPFGNLWDAVPDTGNQISTPPWFKPVLLSYSWPGIRPALMKHLAGFKLNSVCTVMMLLLGVSSTGLRLPELRLEGVVCIFVCSALSCWELVLEDCVHLLNGITWKRETQDGWKEEKQGLSCSRSAEK